jgi:hypothetical protein
LIGKNFVKCYNQLVMYLAKLCLTFPGQDRTRFAASGSVCAALLLTRGIGFVLLERLFALRRPFVIRPRAAAICARGRTTKASRPSTGSQFPRGNCSVHWARECGAIFTAGNNARSYPQMQADITLSIC